MRYRVLPYRQGSKSARALADALGGKVLKLEGSKYKPKAGDVVITWGNTNSPWNDDDPMTLLNWPNAIHNASNKLVFFQRMKEKGHEDIIPRFWTSKQDIPPDAYPIVCRTVLAGHSGDGIVIADTPADLVDAPLYVQYMKKKEEYRVHVGRKTSFEPTGPVDGTTVIAVQRKARRHDTPDENVNWKVRNHSNGFVFVRGGFTPNPHVIDAARSALVASGLDFGAVDVIWNEHEGKAYVLEINTAPGLEGQTVADYANFFKGVS